MPRQMPPSPASLEADQVVYGPHTLHHSHHAVAD